MKARMAHKFFKDELKRVELAHGEDGLFYCRTLWLDRDTLKITKVLSKFTKSSMDATCAMYLRYFKEGNRLEL